MWIDLSQKQGGDSIGRVLIIESSERNAFVIDEILNGLKKYSDFEFLWLQHNPVLSLPDMEIDPIHRKVCCGGQKLSLTAKEYDLLCLFATNKGCILTYDQIYEKIWKEKAFGNANNAIACHVHNLREKISKALPQNCFSFRCIREVGYCFEVNSECAVGT